MSVVITPFYEGAEYSSAVPSYSCLWTLGDTNTGSCSTLASHDPTSHEMALLFLSATSYSCWAQERHPDCVDLYRQEAEYFAFIVCCFESKSLCLILRIKAMPSTSKFV